MVPARDRLQRVRIRRRAACHRGTMQPRGSCPATDWGGRAGAPTRLPELKSIETSSMSTSFACVLKYNEPVFVMPTDRTLPIPAFNRCGMPGAHASRQWQCPEIRRAAPVAREQEMRRHPATIPSTRHSPRSTTAGMGSLPSMAITKMSRCDSCVACRDVEREGASVR